MKTKNAVNRARNTNVKVLVTGTEDYLSIEDFIILSLLKGKINEEDIINHVRKVNIKVPREAYWHYLSLIGLGTRRIAVLANRKRETVRSGIRTLKNMLDTNDPLLDWYRSFLNDYFTVFYKSS
jgi:hypothetical protein